MPRPTKEQLRKINERFAHTPLEEDQVYVFRSRSADTKPVRRITFFGDEYYIRFTEKFLKKLKKDYQKGVALLASHDSGKLPFGRTFDAEIVVDEVDGENVTTLYIDHFIVTHVKNEKGEKAPLKTEVGGMTTEDIVNHIEVGHIFDTSIGFSIEKPICSICGNSLLDWDNCNHIPGETYEVDGEKLRCDVLVENGEGLENSLVYAGAVDRAEIIRQQNYAKNSSEVTGVLHRDVKFGSRELYTVGDFKNLPKGAVIYCYLSKNSVDFYTTTPERRDFKKFMEEREKMEKEKELTAPQATEELHVQEQEEVREAKEQKEEFKKEDFVAKAEFEKVVKEREELALMVEELQTKVEELSKQIEDLKPKAKLAEQFTEDLVQETIKAAIAARGNALNAERYEKYLRTLSVEELKEEFKAMKDELKGKYEVRLTKSEVETDREAEELTELSDYELRQKAAQIALERFKKEGGDLAELTREEYEKLKQKAVK